MFRGATKVTLDAKGRMVIPTRYRQALMDPPGDQFYLWQMLEDELLPHLWRQRLRVSGR